VLQHVSAQRSARNTFPAILPYLRYRKLLTSNIIRPGIWRMTGTGGPGWRSAAKRCSLGVGEESVVAGQFVVLAGDVRPCGGAVEAGLFEPTATEAARMVPAAGTLAQAAGRDAGWQRAARRARLLSWLYFSWS
jgi:hypothetical protein